MSISPDLHPQDIATDVHATPVPCPDPKPLAAAPTNPSSGLRSTATSRIKPRACLRIRPLLLPVDEVEVISHQPMLSTPMSPKSNQMHHRKRSAAPDSGFDSGDDVDVEIIRSSTNQHRVTIRTPRRQRHPNSSSSKFNKKYNDCTFSQESSSSSSSFDVSSTSGEGGESADTDFEKEFKNLRCCFSTDGCNRELLIQQLKVIVGTVAFPPLADAGGKSKKKCIKICKLLLKYFSFLPEREFAIQSLHTTAKAFNAFMNRVELYQKHCELV